MPRNSEPPPPEAQVFGTDGVRGRSNRHPVTPWFVQRLGMAVGAEFTRGDHSHHVVIGKDTRLSGYMVETAITSGLLSQGMNVLLVGPLPTAAIPMLVHSMRCDVGVMISASHNAWEDNGIKLFGPDGLKISEAAEAAIGKRLRSVIETEPLVDSPRIGRARRISDAAGRYIERTKRTFPAGLRLDGIRVVIDCAHGAAYRVAPQLLWELGADVTRIGVAPDGTNINRGCGSTAPEAMTAKVKETGAHIGIALDGDADRCLLADERGRVVDGDRLLALIVRERLAQGRVEGGRVVGTLMSNLGFERYLESLGLGLVRAPVGDRHVSETMRRLGCNVGGESSGHIILREHGETGDGLVSALQALAALAAGDGPLSAILPDYAATPRHQADVPLADGAGPADAERLLASSPVRAAVAEAESRLGEGGRVVVRASGTEPKVRLLAESADGTAAREAVAGIAAALEAEAAVR